MIRRLVPALVLALVPVARADEPPSLEAGLVREARPILEQLRAANVQNVGVLKFLLAREGEGRFSDSLGPLNSLLARRLEVALVVRNSPQRTVGVIENASAVAAKLPGANHLSRAGLETLFAANYPLAWGRQRVKADAFLAGNGMVSADRRTLSLSVVLIDAASRKPKVVADGLKLRLRPEHLAEAGESFHRGAFDRDDNEPTPTATPEPARLAEREQAVAAEAAKVVRQEKPHPLQDPAAPFTLELVYDGRVQPIEFRDGRAWVPEPTQGQRVAVRYGRRDGSDKTFLVVIKVNGENTLGRQKLPDDQSRAWVIPPKLGRGPWELAGFQVTDDQSERFRVASKAESKAREVDYGTDVGTVSLTVFAERTGKPARPKTYDQKDAELVKHAELPGGDKKGTFAELQSDLYSALDRGLIVEGGERVGSKVESVKVERDPTPVMAATVNYYRK